MTSPSLITISSGVVQLQLNTNTQALANVCSRHDSTTFLYDERSRRKWKVSEKLRGGAGQKRAQIAWVYPAVGPRGVGEVIRKV